MHSFSTQLSLEGGDILWVFIFAFPVLLLRGKKSLARGSEDATEAFVVHSSISQPGLYRHGLTQIQQQLQGLAFTQEMCKCCGCSCPGPSLAKGLARSGLSSAVPLTKHPDLCWSWSNSCPSQSLLSQPIYPLRVYKTFLQLCWQLENLIACLMILGGGFNETSSSWGMKESQGSYKTN